jgi:hypothetical protein
MLIAGLGCHYLPRPPLRRLHVCVFKRLQLERRRFTAARPRHFYLWRSAHDNRLSGLIVAAVAYTGSHFYSPPGGVHVVLLLNVATHVAMCVLLAHPCHALAPFSCLRARRSALMLVPWQVLRPQIRIPLLRLLRQGLRSCLLCPNHLSSKPLPPAPPHPAPSFLSASAREVNTLFLSLAVTMTKGPGVSRINNQESQRCNR